MTSTYIQLDNDVFFWKSAFESGLFLGTYPFARTLRLFFVFATPYYQNVRIEDNIPPPLLAIGYWLLTIGYWLLAIGY